MHNVTSVAQGKYLQNGLDIGSLCRNEGPHEIILRRAQMRLDTQPFSSSFVKALAEDYGPVLSRLFWPDTVIMAHNMQRTYI